MKLSLLLSKLKLSLLKKTGKANNVKTYESWCSKGYNPYPLVSFIIQSHNKSLQVEHIVGKLREYVNSEIIVIDDGSEESHTKRYVQLLTNANEFLVHANDLYEVSTYDKVIRFANGKYIALLQDDDDFEGINWIEQAVHYFKAYPLLAILGGKDGIDIKFNHQEQIGKGVLSESSKEKDFNFVQAVNRAPMWINKELFVEKLKHIDQTFAPFQYDDYEICIRAWLSGLQVGHYDAGFKSLSVGGMRLWNNLLIQHQCLANGQKLYKMYASEEEQIQRFIVDAQKKK